MMSASGMIGQGGVSGQVVANGRVRGWVVEHMVVFWQLCLVFEGC